MLNIERSRLSRAVSRGDLRKVQALINSSDTVQLKSWPGGHSLLLRAIRARNAKIAELLLENDCTVQKGLSKRSIQPLHLAVVEENPKIVEKLLDRRASPNVRDEKGKTPLYYAIERLSLPKRSKIKIAITRCLLSRGADVNIGDDGDMKPLHLAVMQKVREKVLLEYDEIDDESDMEYNEPDIQYDECFKEVLANACWIVENLLSQGANINCACSLLKCKKYTTLHFAASIKGYGQLVEILVKNGANVNGLSEDHYTPLYLATKIYDEDIVKILLDNGADVNIPDVRGTTILQVAVKTGNAKIVKLILQARPDVNNESNKKCVEIGMKKLASSFFPGYVIQMLVDEYKVILQALLDSGFNVEAKDANDYKAIKAAVSAGCSSVVQQLLRFTNTAGNGLLHLAATGNHEDMVKLLLSHGANVSIKDEFGELPVFYAIRNNNATITRLLLPTETKLKVEGDLMNMAVLVGSRKIVDILLEYDPNIDVNAIDRKGFRALHCAAVDRGVWLHQLKRGRDWRALEHAKTEIAGFLLTKGARPELCCTEGRSALDIAASFGRIEFVKILLEHGADVNAIYGSRSPLHWAVDDEHLNWDCKLYEVLLKFGADIESRDEFGRTPLHVACGSGSVPVIKFLLECGADINAISADGDRIAGQYAEMARESLYPHYFSHERSDDILNVLMEHIVKMIATNKHVSETNLQWVDATYKGPRFDDFFTQCRTEIDRLRIKTIGNSDVSFYDVYSKDLDHLMIYAKNESIVRAFESNNNEQEFPVYWKFIVAQFKRGKEREKLFRAGHNVAKSLFRYAFPKSVIYRILRFLRIDDLANLVQVFPNVAESETINE